jgi:SAM-dependent methyltransferase
MHATHTAPRPSTGASTGFQLSGSAAERYEAAVGAFMLPWAAHLIDQVHLSQGERVLDLACGTGFVGRLAAARVGRHGEVTGLDVNPAMVAEARQVTGLEIVESSAEATGLPPAAFDVVLCQQGLQYFSDAAAVIDESMRLLRPNGRVAMSVWAGFERNPFRVAQLRAMASHLNPRTSTPTSAPLSPRWAGWTASRDCSATRACVTSRCASTSSTSCFRRCESTFRGSSRRHRGLRPSPSSRTPSVPKPSATWKPLEFRSPRAAASQFP